MLQNEAFLPIPVINLILLNLEDEEIKASFLSNLITKKSINYYKENNYNKNKNPSDLYREGRFFSLNYYNIHYFPEACFSKSLTLVQILYKKIKFVQKDYFIQKGIEIAKELKNELLLDFLFKKRKEDDSKILFYSCKKKERRVICDIIDNGFYKKLDYKPNYNEGLYGACYGEKLENVIYTVEKGADDINKGLEIICEHTNNAKIASYLLNVLVEKSEIEAQEKIYFKVCYLNKFKLFKVFVKHFYYHEKAFIQAAEAEHSLIEAINIIDYLIENNYYDLEDCLYTACSNNLDKVVGFLLEKNPSNIEDCFKQTSSEKIKKLLKIYLD